MPIDPITGAKLWLTVKPIKRFRKWRNRRRIRKGKEPLPDTEEIEMPNLLGFLAGPISKLLAAGIGLVVGKAITAIPFVATLIGVDAADPASVAAWVDMAVEWVMVLLATYIAPANTIK